MLKFSSFDRGAGDSGQLALSRDWVAGGLPRMSGTVGTFDAPAVMELGQFASYNRRHVVDDSVHKQEKQHGEFSMVLNRIGVPGYASAC